MKVAQLLKFLEREGWIIARIKGSHRQLKHPIRKGLITIAGKPSDEIKKGTLGSILRISGLNVVQKRKRQ